MGQKHALQGGASWLEKKLSALEAIYDRFGREGLKDQPLADVGLLENQKVAGFKASVEDMKKSPDNHMFEEMDGGLHPWVDLSAAAKLQYIALDAARNDVSFEPFAEVVRETIGEVGEAALGVVLDGQKELHAIAMLFPDDWRTEPTPLVEQVREMLEYVSALEGKPPPALTGRTDPPALSLEDLRNRRPDQVAKTPEKTKDRDMER